MWRIWKSAFLNLEIIQYEISAFARVKTNDYLSVQYSIMSDVKDAFDKYGIDIPYPQRVVYVQNVDTSTGELKGTKKKLLQRMWIYS